MILRVREDHGGGLRRVCVCVKVELVRVWRFYIYRELFLPHSNRCRRRRNRRLRYSGYIYIYRWYLREYSYFVFSLYEAVYEPLTPPI